MPRAVIDPGLCRPGACDDGVCRARKLCPVKAVWQPELGEVPVIDTIRCHGCGKCLSACGVRAIRLA